MRNYRFAIYRLVLTIVALLILGIGGWGAGTARAQEPEVDASKADAVILSLLAEQGIGAQTVTVAADSPFQPANVSSPQIDVAVSTVDGQTIVNVMIKTNGSLDGIAELGVDIGTVIGPFLTANVPVEALGPLTALPNVEFVEAARQLQESNDRATAATGIADFRVQNGTDGSGVIVGVIDSGFDFTHADFRNPDGSTRILLLCDMDDPPQTGDSTCPGADGEPGGGTLWTADHIDAHLATLDAGTLTDGAGTFVRHIDTGGHGTLVTASAAGNHPLYTGAAPGAHLILVDNSRGSFTQDSFTTATVAAIEFILAASDAFGLPVVINQSQRMHFGPHDASDLLVQAVDFLFGPVFLGECSSPGQATRVAW